MRMNQLKSALEILYEFSYYNLSHPDPVFFIHQYAVDAFADQYADENTNLLLLHLHFGLYLHLEKNFTGKFKILYLSNILFELNVHFKKIVKKIYIY